METKFKDVCNGKIKKININFENIEETRNTITNIVKQAAGEVIDRQQRQRQHKPWITNDVLKVMEEKRCYKNILTEEGKNQYNRLRNSIDRECKCLKEQW